MKQYVLTICIATYNRAEYLSQTLDVILSQTADLEDVEVLVVDGNSTDNTEEAVRFAQSVYRNLNYVRLPEKGGVDKDFDTAVQCSSGSYCWLFTDDDLLKDGAIRAVRREILNGSELVIVNSEICDYDFERVLKSSALGIVGNQQMTLSPKGRDNFFRTCGTYITFIGAVVIKKDLWTALSRQNFYGTRFIHVGVISTLPDSVKVLVIAEPLIRIRLGNAEWSNISFKVWTQLWPKLIWSFPNLSAECKRSICLYEPWKSVTFLLWSRALGSYSLQEYRNFISIEIFSIRRLVALVIALVPRLFPRLIYFIYAAIRNDQLMFYHLRDGEKSKNSWFSTE